MGMVCFMTGKVEICGVNTAKLPIYKEAEMTEMLLKIKEGERETRMALLSRRYRRTSPIIIGTA